MKSVYLAYMGTDGFKGTLEGIFRGYLESTKGIINGYAYDNKGIFSKGNSVLDWDNLRNYNSGCSEYIGSSGSWDVYKTQSPAKHIFACSSSFNDANGDGFTQLENVNPRITVNLSPSGSGTSSIANIYKLDDGGASAVFWASDFDNSFDGRFNQHYMISDVDIGEGAQLQAGLFYLVYES